MSTPVLPAFLAEDLLSRLRDRFASFPLIQGWNLHIESLAPGRALLKAGPSERILNGPGGTINGGVLATLADMTCALALSTVFDGAMPFATGDLHIRYLDPARVSVAVEATILRLSARGAVLECRLASEGITAALGTAHFSLSARRRPDEG